MRRLLKQDMPLHRGGCAHAERRGLGQQAIFFAGQLGFLFNFVFDATECVVDRLRMSVQLIRHFFIGQPADIQLEDVVLKRAQDLFDQILHKL